MKIHYILLISECEYCLYTTISFDFQAMCKFHVYQKSSDPVKAMSKDSINPHSLLRSLQKG